MPRPFRLVVSVTILIVSNYVACESAAAANVSKFQNKVSSPAGKRSFWVTRRHPNDPNGAGDVAVAFRILDDNQRPGNELEGVLYLYKRGASGALERRTYYVSGVPAGGGSAGGVGENSHRRETCTFKDSEANPKIFVRVSLYKGKDKGNPAHRRVILRYKEIPAVRPVPAKAPAKESECGQVPEAPALPATTSDCCDDEPNEDVLEEEELSVTPDGDPSTPPP